MDLDKQEICIRSDIIKRFINRSVEKERYLFLAMCSNQDADRVLGKLKMVTKDIGYGCVDVEEEQKKIRSWERQFIDQLPTEKMKENIRRVFEQG